jgi:hypothetical protein
VDYEQLLMEAKGHLENADFTAIRYAYTQTAGYEPYSVAPNMTSLDEAMQRQDWLQASSICLELLQADFLQIRLHQLAAYLLEQADQLDLAKWHTAFANGLTASILQSGDGRSFENAWQVVHIREEYDVLRLLNLTLANQALIVYNERHYDVLEVVGQDGQLQGRLFFDVELLQRHPRSRQ